MTEFVGIDQFVQLSAHSLEQLSKGVLGAINCNDAIATFVARHLVQANLMGIDSHGVVRLPQYVEQVEADYFSPAGTPVVTRCDRGATVINGSRGFGMPAMQLAIETGITQAKTNGVAALGITNCGHTGRLGAFCETGARNHCLTIILGGGARRNWRQVAPFGGSKGMLPTNPYSFGIPGGERGPVILDFATSVGAAGWIYAAKSAGASLPKDMIIDRNGHPSQDPQDYIDGGALLPAGGAKGYGLALLAEIVGEAMLGRVTTDMNWIMIVIDLERFQGVNQFSASAEAILAEMRECPPADGFSAVEIPGEREKATAEQRQRDGIPIPQQSWEQITAVAARLGVPVTT
jgi:LDH2 family malate/lactate/ureidoglycolate dehydrogenase